MIRYFFVTCTSTSRRLCVNRATCVFILNIFMKDACHERMYMPVVLNSMIGYVEDTANRSNDGCEDNSFPDTFDTVAGSEQHK